jgi:hypothetical protein
MMMQPHIPAPQPPTPTPSPLPPIKQTRSSFTFFSMLCAVLQLLPPPIIPRPNLNSINGKLGAAKLAAARAPKNLVGAAKASYLARIARNNAAGMASQVPLYPDGEGESQSAATTPSQDALPPPQVVGSSMKEMARHHRVYCLYNILRS